MSAGRFQNEGDQTRCDFGDTPFGRIMIKGLHVEPCERAIPAGSNSAPTRLSRFLIAMRGVFRRFEITNLFVVNLIYTCRGSCRAV